ncbi:MAG: hypothetical protein IT306_18305 [Chloroflexi bacterium]|nr:hypothetical protein [Chloroflexota bacterium]
MPSLTAEVLYDTQTVSLPYGVRTVRGHERRLLFTAAEYEIVLEVVAGEAAGWLRLAGQLLADGEPVPAAIISLEDGVSTETDLEGRFKLVQGLAVRCGFWAQAGDMLIIVPPFDIGTALAGAA